jgi:hypothetical protein
MRLDADATAHLHRLAAHTPRKRKPFRTEPVPPGIRQLVASWTTSPALVIGPVGDVRVANPPAEALSPAHRQGANLLRETFLNPAVRDLHRDWDDLTVSLAAGLRAYAGTSADDPRLAALVGELSVHSEQFRRLWARHDVRPRSGGTALLDHPQLGLLDLRLEKLAVTGTTGLMLLVYHAEPDSPSAHGLALLASLADHRTELQDGHAALEADARGCVPKAGPPEDLLRAVRTAAPARWGWRRRPSAHPVSSASTANSTSTTAQQPRRKPTAGEFSSSPDTHAVTAVVPRSCSWPRQTPFRLPQQMPAQAGPFPACAGIEAALMCYRGRSTWNDS